MMNPKYKQWINAIDKFVLEKYDECKCPNCSEKNIKVIYVGDKKTRIGYLQAWCEGCKVGIYCSRVLIPEGVEIISFEDKDNIQLKSVPKYKMIMPV